MTQRTRISVIVCTRDRAALLPACLDSIARSLSAAAPASAEIVVVDNASKDDTAVVVRAWAVASPFPVQLLHERKPGLSAARNCGLRHAKGDLLVFTDDDCRFSLEYVADALRRDDASDGLVLRGGRVELGDPADIALTVKSSLTPERWHRVTHPARHSYLGESLIGANFTMRRALADRIGLFDEHLGAGSTLPGGEDSDYIFRAYLAGFAIEYVPDMMLYHHHGRKTPAEGFGLLRNYMLATGALYVKYILRDINLCRQFYWDIKCSLAEVRTGRSTCWPSVGFSHVYKVRFCVQGAFRYLLILLSPRGLLSQGGKK